MKILITRNLSDQKKFIHHLPDKAEVTEQSFIEIQSIPFTIPGHLNWIFFSSKNAVSSFLKQHPLPHGVKIGAVSKATSDFLNEKNYECDYIGNPLKSTEENALEFANQSEGKVFFPSSNQSLLTFPKALPNDRAIVKKIYKTSLSPIKIEGKFDYYLFTSPSNVDGYLLKNDLYDDSKIVVIGNSTASRISKLNSNVKVYISEESSEIGLAKKVKEIEIKG